MGVRLGSDEKRRGDAFSLSMTVSPSASMNKDEASEISEVMEEKREGEDLFAASLIFNY